MNNRYYSLDTFRGATVALMILVNNPGSWISIYAPLEHAKWNGCTPTDLVFPFFLFAVGTAIAFVMPKFKENGSAFFWKKVVKRFFLIFLIGLLLNWSPFLRWDEANMLVFKPWSFWAVDKVSNTHFEDGIRILGVLQRIAICYLIASIVAFYCKPKVAFVISINILLLYWLMCLFWGSPSAPFEMSGYFGRRLDIFLLTKHHLLHIDKLDNKIYHFDYEGVASSITAIVQVIFGFLVGNYIKKSQMDYETLAKLLIIGILMVFVGYCWDFAFPINKKIWSSSYTVYTTGLAIIVLSILIYLIELKNKKGAWSRFFDVFGKNALFIFVLSGFLPRLLGLIKISEIDAAGNQFNSSPLSWFYNHFCKNILPYDLRFGSLVYAIILLTFYWLIVFVLDKKKIYIKV